MKCKFKIGDLVKTTGTIRVKGRIWSISEGGKKLGFPWIDETPHYEIIDERTKLSVFAHEKNVELFNSHLKEHGK